MSKPYSEIFKPPGAKGFAAAGFIARLPIAMATIGIVAMLSQTHGKYWLAGAVAATFALTNALVAPQISRLVDRSARRRILVPATTLSVARLRGLMLAAHSTGRPGRCSLRRCSPRRCPACRPWCGRAGRSFTAARRSSTPLSPSSRLRTSSSTIAGSSRWPSVSASPCSRRPARSPRRSSWPSAPLPSSCRNQPNPSAAGRKERRRLGDPPAPGADHHLRPGGHRRHLRHGGSDRHRASRRNSASRPRPASCSAGYAARLLVRWPRRTAR